MTDQERVPVTICGQSFVVKTDQDGEYVRLLANSVDERLKEMRKANPSLTPGKAAILLCLELQDEKNRMEKDYDDLSDELDKIDII
ncbi:MAG: cell division protein ZapA [Bacillota bacterium]|nr:cell division protein ZapA [Bacillota bacterium]